MELVKIIDGKPYTSSRLIAQYFNKKHKYILTAISDLGCTEEFSQLNFLSIFPKDNYGGKRFEYAITQDGCLLLVMCFTGRKAGKLKKHIKSEFHCFKGIIRDQQQLTRHPPKPKRNFGTKINEIYKCFKNTTLEGWVALLDFVFKYQKGFITCITTIFPNKTS